MKDEARVWLTYAEENLKAAQLLLAQKLYNPCLQNVQQSIEKALKALLLERSDASRKTHAITELVRLLAEAGIKIRLQAEDCDLLDSIYLPSKYPLGGVLPAFDPDDELCAQCVVLAKVVLRQVKQEAGVAL